METVFQGQTSSIQEQKTIVLRKPVELGGVTYEKLELREPTAGELDKATRSGGNVATAITLISLVAKVPRGAVEMLSQRDFQEANDFLGSFTADGLETGPMSSLS